MVKESSGVPMVSIGGDQLDPVDGALRQHEQPPSEQGVDSCDSCAASSSQLLASQQDRSTSTIGSGPQHEDPEAVLTMQQHSGITAAVSRAMKRWAG